MLRWCPRSGVLLYFILICLMLSLTVFLLTAPTDHEKAQDPVHDPFPWEYEQQEVEEDVHVQRKGRSLQEAFRATRSPEIFMTSKAKTPTLPSKRRYDYSVVQESRHMALDLVCRTTNHTWRDLTNEHRQAVAQRIVVNDEYKILYCSVPLVATGPWMKVMYYLRHEEEFSDAGKVPAKELGNRKNFVYLNSFSAEEQEKRINSYLKFVVTRHPFVRIAIAYKLKFEAANTFFHQRYGKEIVKKYRSGATGDQSGSDVKFSEFVEYLSDTKDPREMNEHWQLLETLCGPCAVGYDFILHHETLQQDVRELLEQAQLTDHVLSLPREMWDYVPIEYVHGLFKGITPVWVGKLVQQYGRDFALFSYSSLF